MLELIVEFLNLKVGLTSYFEVNHCLTTLVETDANEVYPAKYISNGNYEKINLDASDGASYIRLTDEPKTTRNAAKYTPKPKVDITFPMRFVYSVRRSKLTDDAYAQDRIRESLTKQIESDPDDLKISLGADNVRINVSSSLVGKKLWDEETANTGTYQPKTDIVYAALDFDVIVSVRVDCILDECDFDTDILHSFDFCKAAVRARLTASQVTCLEDALCGVPEPVIVSVNDTQVAEVTCGEPYNVDVEDTLGNAVGTGANPSVVANSTVTVNSASLGATGSVLAEGSLDIPVTQSGSPVGSWNGSAWVIPPVDPCSSISLAVSNTTPPFGQQIILDATATDFTGTITYFFIVRNSIGGWEKIQQSGNTYNWNASYAGTYMVHVIAEDTDGNSASSCVSITVGTLEAKYSIDAAYGKTVTLVSDKVDVWSDLTGNSHNATAPSATTRGYTTKWGGSAECVGVSTENDDRLITNLNMNTSEVTLYGVFDFNDNTIQGAFNLAGIISGDSNITSCRYNATILDDTISPRTVNFQVRTSSGAFTITGNIVNGKVIFVFKYSAGTMRTIINGTTSSQSVTGTLVGTGTINYALLNVNTNGWGGPCPFPVYSVGIKTSALSDSDQDQLYADLLVKYPA